MLRAPMRVDIVVEHIPHYRAAFVAELDQSKSIDATWVAGESPTRQSGIPGSDSKPRSLDTVSNCPLPFGLTWQRGVLKHSIATRSQAVVFTGDPHIVSTWLASPLLRLRGIKVLFWTHGWRGEEQGLKRALRISFYKLANGLLLYGQFGRRVGRSYGYKKPIWIVGNSNGAPIVPASADGVRDRSKSQRWAVVSRLFNGRKIEQVIQAVALLSEQGKTVNLVVVGDGPERQALEAESQRLGLTCDFHGAVYDENRTAQLLSSSDVLVSPGHIGLSAVHSMSSGCPVATHGNMHHQMPEAAAVANGVTGILFEEDNVTDLAERVWDFVSHYDRSSISDNCHKEVLLNWSVSAQLEAFEEALASAITVRK